MPLAHRINKLVKHFLDGLLRYQKWVVTATIVVIVLFGMVLVYGFYLRHDYYVSLPRVAIVNEPCYVFGPVEYHVRIWEVVGKGTTTDNGSPCVRLRPYMSDDKGTWFCGESVSPNLKVGQMVVYESIENKLCVVDLDNSIAILSTPEQVRNRTQQE